MVQFRIQPDSEIPASTQLFNQIRFAIASRQFPRSPVAQYASVGDADWFTAIPSARFTGSWRITGL